MSPFEESSPLTGPVWSRFLSAGFPVDSPQRREAQDESAMGFEGISARRADYVRDRLVALNPADLHPLRVEVEQLRAQKSVELQARLTTWSGLAADTPAHRECGAEVAVLRAALAQLDVLDHWIAAAMEGKSLAWPAAFWDGAAPRARLWDFHTTQSALAEAWLEHVQAQAGNVAPEHAQARAETLDRLIRHAELGMLERAVDALEHALMDARDEMQQAQRADRISAMSGWTHQWVNLLDALLLARDLLKAYPAEEEALPLGVDPVEIRSAIRDPDVLAHRVGVGLMRDRLFHHYETYLALEAKVREAEAALAEGRLGDAEDVRFAVEDAHWLGHVLGAAYARYLDAIDVAIGDVLRPSPLTLDYRTRHPRDPRAEHAGPALVEEVRAGMTAIDAFMRDADGRLALAEPSLLDASRTLAPYAGEDLLGTLRRLAKQLEGGLRCRPQPAPLDQAVPRTGTSEPPTLGLGRTAARLTVVLAAPDPETRRRLAAENLLALHEADAPGPAEDAATRLFVTAGPGGLALPVED